MRLRSFEASAAHQTAIVSMLYEDDANCTATRNETCGVKIERKKSDIGLDADAALTVGSFEGFFVAPITANYTFLATWDASLELSLGSNADPRSRKIVLGGLLDAQSIKADGDEINDWYYHKGHWYKVLQSYLSWADAGEECIREGGHLAQIEGEAEQAFVFDLIRDRATSSFVFLGASDIDVEDEWLFANAKETDNVLGAGSGSRFFTAHGKYANWASSEPNNCRRPVSDVTVCKNKMAI